MPEHEHLGIGSAAVVLRWSASRGATVLLVRRERRSRDGRALPFAGKWVLPGGKIDPEDFDGPVGSAPQIGAARRAAVREVGEEVGVELREEAVTYLWRIESVDENEQRYRIDFFEAVLPAPQQPILQRGELSDLVWARPSDACEACREGRLDIAPATIQTLTRLAQRDGL